MLPGLFYYPLHPVGRQGDGPARSVIAIKKPLYRMLRRKIGLYATYEQIAQGYIAVFAALALTDMKLFPVHIYILDM